MQRIDVDKLFAFRSSADKYIKIPEDVCMILNDYVNHIRKSKSEFLSATEGMIHLRKEYCRSGCSGLLLRHRREKTGNLRCRISEPCCCDDA